MSLLGKDILAVLTSLNFLLNRLLILIIILVCFIHLSECRIQSPEVISNSINMLTPVLYFVFFKMTMIG